MKKRIVLITGGASGIGLATAQLFLKKEEALICIIDASPNIELQAEKIGAALFLRGDAGEEKTFLEIAKRIDEHFGRLDVLINNVGISTLHHYYENDTVAFDTVMRINVRSAFLATETLLPLLKKSQTPSIVNISSSAAKIGDTSPMYAASKAALLGLTRYYARTLAPKIRVNSLAPGGVAHTGVDKKRPEARRQSFKERTPLGRLAEPAEIAEAIYFLASPAASYITGECLDVNGGLYMD